MRDYGDCLGVWNNKLKQAIQYIMWKGREINVALF